MDAEWLWLKQIPSSPPLPPPRRTMINNIWTILEFLHHPPLLDCLCCSHGNPYIKHSWVGNFTPNELKIRLILLLFLTIFQVASSQSALACIVSLSKRDYWKMICVCARLHTQPLAWFCCHCRVTLCPRRSTPTHMATWYFSCSLRMGKPLNIPICETHTW